MSKYYALHIAGRNAASDNNECKFLEAAVDLSMVMRRRGITSEVLRYDPKDREYVEAATERIAIEEFPNGGTFLLTYTGHGREKKMCSNNVPDGAGWLLGEHFTYHEEGIRRLLVGKFRYDVRVIVISDCCYAKAIDPSRLFLDLVAAKMRGLPLLSDDLLREALGDAEFEYFYDLYQRSRDLCTKIEHAPKPSCDYMHISAGKGGDVTPAVFTRAICAILEKAQPGFTYGQLVEALKALNFNEDPFESKAGLATTVTVGP
ncbi:MAG: hypothetical protein JNL82_39685 [Myxococcales bacterium]|nr:hypothetical protein [Myxococcales bacterium]